MTLNDFMVMLQKKVDEGYGDKTLLIEDTHQNLHIHSVHTHSVQANTYTGTEPNYLIIIKGEEATEYE